MNATLDKTTLKEWHTLYEQCTPEERLSITKAMLQKIESRQMESVEYYKKMPLALEALPASELMDVVEVALNDVYHWLMENFPQAREKLLAYESLSIFYMTQGEKSYRDMTDAIDSICKVWDVSLFPVSTETPKPNTKAKNKTGAR
jgi:hypothetical protein